MAQPRILALFGNAVLLGQERGNIEALAALKESGCEVLCLVRDEAWSVHISPALDARGLAWVKVPYIEHRLPGRIHYFLFRNPVAFLLGNWRFFRIVRVFQPTHIHASNPLYMLNFLIGLASFRLPVIYRAGDTPTVHNFFWRTLWRFVVWRVHQFVANAHFVARALEKGGVSASRISVIYNAPPVRTEQALSQFRLPDGEIERRIVYVGQISPHKGVHVLIDAFRLIVRDFPDAQLAIAGRISDWKGDAWGRQLRDETLRDPLIGNRVCFLGEVPEVAGLFAECGFHVAPSLFEDPSPNVVMEAKQASRPSIVFPRGGMPELVENGVDGIVCDGATSQALAEAMRHYLADPGLVRRHGEAAFASLGRLGVPQFGQRWMEIYCSLPQEQTSPRQTSSAKRDAG